MNTTMTTVENRVIRSKYVYRNQDKPTNMQFEGWVIHVDEQKYPLDRGYVYTKPNTAEGREQAIQLALEEAREYKNRRIYYRWEVDMVRADGTIQTMQVVGSDVKDVAQSLSDGHNENIIRMTRKEQAN